MSKDLFLAILSMDAYNHDYGANIQVDGTGIGTATILGDSDILKDINGNRLDEAAGFYAITYDWNGKTVISYRGTNADDWSNFFDDAWNGYLVGAGNPFQPQAYLAADFFKAVTGTGDGDPRTADVILTGHSLGGGLTGFIAALYGQDATIFDNMTFEDSALLASDPNDPGHVASSLHFYNGEQPWQTQIGTNITAHAATGELLTTLRALFPQQTPVQYHDSNGGFRDLFGMELHSQALLVVTMFAEENGHTDWISIGGALWDAAFWPLPRECPSNSILQPENVLSYPTLQSRWLIRSTGRSERSELCDTFGLPSGGTSHQ